MCRRDRADWCSGNEFIACSSADDRAEIMFKMFQAGIRSGVNVQQYQRGQRNLTSFAYERIHRRQTQANLGSSNDDGHAL